MNPISDDELGHLLKFIGYGSISAPVWFLGMEEGGGGEENLRKRLTFEAIEDCKQAHAKLGITHFHGDHPRIQRTWRSMCYIMLSLSNQAPTKSAIREYQSAKLGRANGDTLLIELMPIPKPRVSNWEYEKLLPQYASRDDYYQSVLPQRTRLLKKLITNHHPQTVIGYGKRFWKEYQQLFPETEFTAQDGFLTTRSDETSVILCDHFTARSMNGRLDMLTEVIRNKSHGTTSIRGE